MMRKFWAFIGLWCAVEANATVPMGAERALRQRQWRVAATRLRDSVAANPDDPALHAGLGLAYARMGFFGDAVGSFTFAEGSELYEERGITAHADALRYTGHAAEAAALRTSRWTMVPSGFEPVVVLGLVDDSLAMADLEGAERWSQYALASWPASSATHALRAQVLQAEGDDEGAGFHLWLASVRGTPDLRTLWLLTWQALDEGMFDEAHGYIQQALDRRPKDLSFRGLLAESFRREGRAEEGLYVLRQKRFWNTEHPDFLAPEILCLWDLGRTAEAKELAARADALYPEHPWVQQAVALVNGG